MAFYSLSNRPDDLLKEPAVALDPSTSVSDVIRDFRRDQVVEAARVLFGERSTLDVSMSEIAERAGVSRSTLYNHFTTRDDVLAACLEAGQVRLIAAVTEAVDAGGDAVDKLSALIEACVAHVDRSPTFFRLMAARAAEPTAVDASVVELSVTGMKIGELVRSIIEDGAAAGVFTTEVDQATWFVGVVLAGLFQMRPAGSGAPAGDLARAVVALLVDGLSPTPSA